MCGACGTRSHLASRAKEAERLAAGRLRVTPFGPAGYQTATRTGRRAVHPDLDSLLRTLIAECGAGVLDRARDAQDGFVARVLSEVSTT